MTRTARPITAGGRACWCSSMTRRRWGRCSGRVSRRACRISSAAGRCGSAGTTSSPADHVTVTTLREGGCSSTWGTDATAGMTTLDCLLTPAAAAMRLALLIDRRYAPYQKWLGTASGFAVLAPTILLATSAAAVAAQDIAARESPRWPAPARKLPRRQQERGPHHRAARSRGIRGYHGRPAQVLMADRFCPTRAVPLSPTRRWRDLPARSAQSIKPSTASTCSLRHSSGGAWTRYTPSQRLRVGLVKNQDGPCCM